MKKTREGGKGSKFLLVIWDLIGTSAGRNGGRNQKWCRSSNSVFLTSDSDYNSAFFLSICLLFLLGFYFSQPLLFYIVAYDWRCWRCPTSSVHENVSSVLIDQFNGFSLRDLIWLLVALLISSCFVWFPPTRTIGVVWTDEAGDEFLLWENVWCDRNVSAGFGLRWRLIHKSRLDHWFLIASFLSFW